MTYGYIWLWKSGDQRLELFSERHQPESYCKPMMISHCEQVFGSKSVELVEKVPGFWNEETGRVKREYS